MSERGPATASRGEVAAAILAAIEGLPDIVAVYLFGSVARGAAGPLSDIDVAVLLRPGAQESAILGDLTDRLARRLRTDRLDVVSLSSLATPLGYRVLRDGVLLAEHDRAARIRFTVETVAHYLDFEPVRARALAGVSRAILGGQGGR